MRGRFTRSRGIRSMWISTVTAMLIFAMFPVTATNAEGTGVEDGGVEEYDQFEFEAFIKHDDIVDGTAPFDSNDEPGNDAGERNQIVRSWDSITYPLKVTINPKKVDMLENIKLKISGTLDNGVTDGRINARFAVGGKESLQDRSVKFVQEYTIERTGNSVMIPVTLEVQGAEPGVVLTPDIQVEVVSVDGEAINGAVTSFDSLPGVTVSAKVNIKPYVRPGLTDAGYPFLPYTKMLNEQERGEDSDVTGIYAFAVSWGVDKLSGKPDMRGATFPSPEGQINYTVELSGDVYWSSGPKKNRTEKLDFTKDDTPVMMYDHRPVMPVYTSIGSENMLADGKSYRFHQPINFQAPRSSMLGLSESAMERESIHSVLDSGEWTVSTPEPGSQTMTYKGTNTGFAIGSTFPSRQANYWDDRPPQFGLNDKLFSSHAFLVDMQNEYRIDGPNNPENDSNNVYYRAKVTLDDYTDKNGQVIPYNKTETFTHTMRNETGNMSAYGSFKAYPYVGYRVENGYLSDKQRYVWASPVGDASTIVGGDVYFEAKVMPATGMNLYGGYKAVYRWNTDAFELTKAYAAEADRRILDRGYRNLLFDWVAHNRDAQKNYYGVAKFPGIDNRFDAFMDKGKDDYAWYSTFDEAVKHGPVGAIMSDVTAPVGGIKSEPSYIPLHVRHDNIGFGSETKQGTPLVATIDFYAYLDKDRDRMIDVTGNQSHNNPSKWDDSGNLVEMQKPVGGSVNFESLGVVPAKTSTAIESDKDTYYNSETVHWTVKNSVVLPEFGVPDGVDAGVTVTQTLPKGLTYKTGSGTSDGEPVEPEVKQNYDGTTSLVWNLFISNQSRDIPTVAFDTTINPFALSANGVQSSVGVTSVIESDLDGRPVAMRTSSKSITVLKVGMVGIYESINKTYGGKNSDYTVTLSPYTTIEDETGVTGLTHLPLSGDTLGSNYQGEAEIKDIVLRSERTHEDEPVTIYLNKAPVYNTKPQTIDVSRNGWYEYTGNPNELDGAASLLFHVEGKMTNKDLIRIDINVGTAGNAFGDVYLNQTVINSDTDYRLSPVSNRVRYAIRADLELKIERFRIYTNKANEGLPTSIRVAQTVLEPDAVEDKDITLAIYNTENGDKVTEKTYKQTELRRENEIPIPSDGLVRGEKYNYEVRLEGYDEDKIWVRDGEGAIDTDGYTSEERTLTISDADEHGDIFFKGAVMTERELGREIATYFETFKIPAVLEPVVKSGYGFELPVKTEYTNQLLNDVSNRIHTTFTSDIQLEVDDQLLDDSLDYASGDSDSIVVPMDRTDASGVNKVTSEYRLPQLYMERKTGLPYTVNQKENGTVPSEDLLDAGHKLYVPVWIQDTGAYDVSVKNTEPIGSHFMNVNLLRHVHVEAYMFNHTDSDTPEGDELLIHPMEQDEIPRNW
jgi:hypothetical protein